MFVPSFQALKKANRGKGHQHHQKPPHYQDHHGHSHSYETKGKNPSEMDPKNAHLHLLCANVFSGGDEDSKCERYIKHGGGDEAEACHYQHMRSDRLCIFLSEYGVCPWEKVGCFYRHVDGFGVSLAEHRTVVEITIHWHQSLCPFTTLGQECKIDVCPLFHEKKDSVCKYGRGCLHGYARCRYKHGTQVGVMTQTYKGTAPKKTDYMKSRGDKQSEKQWKKYVELNGED